MSNYPNTIIIAKVQYIIILYVRQAPQTTLLYLGIQIDHHLSWNSQVDYVCNKEMRLIGFCNVIYVTVLKNLRNSVISNLYY